MPNAPNSAQPTSSPSSSSSTTATAPTSTQQGRAAPTGSTALSDCAIYSSEDDLLDVPESPVLPTTPTPPSTAAPPPLDSDSDLSPAPDSPVWPGTPTRSSTQPRCTERDCPVREAVRRHHQGPYLHNGERPWIRGTMFGESNPPPHVWESWMKIQAGERGSTVEDDWNVFGFLRWHVEEPKRRVVGN